VFTGRCRPRLPLVLLQLGERRQSPLARLSRRHLGSGTGMLWCWLVRQSDCDHLAAAWVKQGKGHTDLPNNTRPRVRPSWHTGSRVTVSQSTQERRDRIAYAATRVSRQAFYNLQADRRRVRWRNRDPDSGPGQPDPGHLGRDSFHAYATRPRLERYC